MAFVVASFTGQGVRHRCEVVNSLGFPMVPDPAAFPGHAMHITWFGHSCFRIDTGKSRILIDPFLTGNPTFEDSGQKVRDVAKGVTHVALTHGHEDHTGDTVAICKDTGAPFIAVYELAVHMASLGVDKIDRPVDLSRRLLRAPHRRA
jgi:L-ascorbate metabolism protein UlaG (beta-lactamase superfamily)